MIIRGQIKGKNDYLRTNKGKNDFAEVKVLDTNRGIILLE